MKLTLQELFLEMSPATRTTARKRLRAVLFIQRLSDARISPNNMLVKHRLFETVLCAAFRLWHSLKKFMRIAVQCAY